MLHLNFCDKNCMDIVSGTEAQIYAQCYQKRQNPEPSCVWGCSCSHQNCSETDLDLALFCHYNYKRWRVARGVLLNVFNVCHHREHVLTESVFLAIHCVNAGEWGFKANQRRPSNLDTQEILHLNLQKGRQRIQSGVKTKWSEAQQIIDSWHAVNGVAASCLYAVCPTCALGLNVGQFNSTTIFSSRI